MYILKMRSMYTRILEHVCSGGNVQVGYQFGSRDWEWNLCLFFSFLFLSVLYGATYEVLGLSLQCTHDSGFTEGFTVKNEI